MTQTQSTPNQPQAPGLQSNASNPKAKQKPEREEMWWLMLAKSKTMRFFSVSCEFIIFLGCLWLTLVTIMPDAESWAYGGINKFFLVAMGFAVDAALPESWLHVVGQYIDKQWSQFRWSVSIAVLMMILVIANIVYTKLTGSDGQSAAGIPWLVDTLLIARMFIGIVYVTIRECQEFISRKQAKRMIAPEDLAHTLQPIIAQVQDIQAQTTSAIAKVEARTAAALQKMGDEQTRIATLNTLIAEREQQTPVIDQTAIVNAVIAHFAEQFETAMARLTEQQARLLQAPEHRALPEHRTANTEHPNNQQGNERRTANTPRRTPNNIVRLPAPNGESHKDAVYRLLTEDPTRGIRELARLIVCSPATAKQYRDLFFASNTEHGEQTGTDN